MTDKADRLAFDEAVAIVAALADEPTPVSL
jgi:hypothetical protein